MDPKTPVLGPGSNKLQILWPKGKEKIDSKRGLTRKKKNLKYLQLEEHNHWKKRKWEKGRTTGEVIDGYRGRECGEGAFGSH